MPRILPIKELRNTNEISDKCQAKAEPIFITKNGYGDLIVMSMKVYEDLLNSAAIDFAKSPTTSSTGGLVLALQRAILTARPKGRYRKHCYWSSIKRYYYLLYAILLIALLYTFSQPLQLCYQLSQHNILVPRMICSTCSAVLDVCHISSVCFFLLDTP